MYERYENSYYASEFAKFLSRDLIGEDCVIYEPRSIHKPKDHCVIFLQKSPEVPFDFSVLDEYEDVLLITNDKPAAINCSLIVTEEPRLDFIRSLNRFFVRSPLPELHPTAIVHPKAQIGENVSIGAHAVIGPDVSIGDDTAIHQNVVISGKVQIGRHCVIKANSTIGSEGFGFVVDKDRLEHFPQIGNIVIGDDVWIGANSTVERANLDETVIEDGVKIDDLVQIGHDSRIGRLTLVTCGVVVCGRAIIGQGCRLAPRSCINVGVTVGDGALVGMGSVVLSDVPPKMVVVGVPARVLRQRKGTE